MRGAHVLTMDRDLGDLAVGEVHVRDGAIVAVGVAVTAPGAEVIDGKGMICMPGFVDTHWHHWTTLLRPVMQADDPKRTYFPVTFALGLHYTPEDSYRSVRLGLAQALAAGVTTTHNWAHNVRSPAHADAEVRAMRESGLRGRFAYGPALGMPNDKTMDFADIARMKKEIGNDPMLTLGICSRNVDGNTGGTRGAIDAAMAKKEWGMARELACRSRCTPRAPARSSCSTRPACSAPTCSWSTRSTPSRQTGRRSPSTACTTASRRSARRAGPARCSSPR